MVNSKQARCRVMYALACFSATALAACAFQDGSDGDVAGDDPSVGTAHQGLATDIVVYTNTSPASPWRSWSWSSTVALANADAPLASASTSQIKTTAQAAWGALSLAHATGDLSAADYDSISFDVRGPASSSIRLSLETLAGAGGSVMATIPVTTTWTRQTVKVDALRGSLTTFGKINWLAPQAGQTFYVDNVKVVAKVAAAPPPATTPPPSATPPPPPPPPPPPSSPTFPAAPLAVTKGNVVTLPSSVGSYALYVPASYDATHETPTKLLVWAHGCGGVATGDAWEVSPGGSQSWISVSVGGRDGGCWNPSTDTKLVLAALDDVERRLNVDPHRVVIGGYSSGGDLAYRTAFYNAKRFAGIIVENTSPFRDTGSTQAASLAAATWKLNVVHLAHLSDQTYPIGPVRLETDAVKAAGFPMTRIERAGTHWDADTASSGTNYDMHTFLLPYLDAGWTSP